jgi:hypothetical protein
MPHWVPSWQLSITVASAVAVVSAAAQLWLRHRARAGEAPLRKTAVTALLGWEVAILIGLYGMWQLAGSISVMGGEDGLARGRRIWDIERTLHLPGEATVQSAFLPHPWLVQFFNWYYVLAHYNVLLLMLAWLFWRHRDRYREARTVIGLTTFACLAVQLVPVAPPRLIGGHGIVDTAMRYGQSVYGPVGQGFSDQYSAMPSVHIAWSSAVAFFVWRATKSRWRYLGVAHALLTWIVVVVTGNHYWLDGVVAIVLLALAFWTVCLVRAIASRVTQWVAWTPEAPVAMASAASVASVASSVPAPLLSPSADAEALAAGLPARASPPSP